MVHSNVSVANCSFWFRKAAHAAHMIALIVVYPFAHSLKRLNADTHMMLVGVDQ